VNENKCLLPKLFLPVAFLFFRGNDGLPCVYKPPRLFLSIQSLEVEKMNPFVLVRYSGFAIPLLQRNSLAALIGKPFC